MAGVRQIHCDHGFMTDSIAGSDVLLKLRCLDDADDVEI
jgi:hypothetical protein